jgi:hypothetical protein
MDLISVLSLFPKKVGDVGDKTIKPFLAEDFGCHQPCHQPPKKVGDVGDKTPPQRGPLPLLCHQPN